MSTSPAPESIALYFQQGSSDKNFLGLAAH